MPLARVIAASAKAAEPVADWLAQHGYQVETAYPEEPRNQDCDFEIFVEQFSAAEALQHAQQLAERLNCDVLIAPGALQSLQPTVPESGPAPQVLHEPAPGVRHEPALQARHEVVPPAKPPAASEITKQSANPDEKASIPKSARKRRTLDVKKFSAFVWQFVSRFVSKTRASASDSLASLVSDSREHARKIGAQARELRQRSGPPVKYFSARFQEHLARARKDSSRFAVDGASYVSTSGHRLGTTLKGTVGDLRQRAQIGMRQLGAWSKQVRNDWRHRYEQRQQARLRAAAKAQITAEESLRELRAEPLDTAPAPQPVLSVKLTSPAVVNGRGETNHQPHASRERDWQMALVGAAIMASVIMFALGFFTRSADSAGPPVTAGAAQAVPKVVKATVGPAAVTAPSPSSQIESTLPAVETQPKPAAERDHAAHNRVRRAAGDNENDDLNDGEPDVVVRHFAPKTQPQSQPAGKTVAGVKQYSDME